MKLKIILSALAILLGLVALVFFVPPSGRLYQDKNSFTLVWRETWLGLEVAKEVVLETEFWNEDNAQYVSEFSPLFQEVKLTAGDRFWVRKGFRCASVEIDRISGETVSFEVVENGLATQYQSTDSALVFPGFDIGVSAGSANGGELFVFASGVHAKEDESVEFYFPPEADGSDSADGCDHTEFVKFPWETSSAWRELKSEV